ncbi:hypothetical protein YC2023_057847 [Brassica napus]
MEWSPACNQRGTKIRDSGEDLSFGLREELEKEEMRLRWRLASSVTDRTDSDESLPAEIKREERRRRSREKTEIAKRETRRK